MMTACAVGGLASTRLIGRHAVGTSIPVRTVPGGTCCRSRAHVYIILSVGGGSLLGMIGKGQHQSPLEMFTHLHSVVHVWQWHPAPSRSGGAAFMSDVH
jgi:hypothetical protein